MRISDEINHSARRNDKLTINNLVVSFLGCRSSFRLRSVCVVLLQRFRPIVCVSNRYVIGGKPSRLAVSILISAVIGFNRSASVTAHYCLGVQAMRCCSDALKRRDHLLIETAMVSQGAIL